MRLETCIRKELRLKAHRVREVREAEGVLVAEIERIEGRQLTCGGCSRKTQRVHSYPAGQGPDAGSGVQPVSSRLPGLRSSSRARPWADRWQRITKALSLALAQLSRKLSWKETAIHFGVNWKTVSAAVKSAVDRGLKLRPWKPLRAIGIDEVSRSKGQRYLTLIYDLERNRLVWVGENRDAETMSQF